MTESSPSGRYRVVFVVPSFAGGGAERVMVTFANELESQRFQVAIVALSGDGPLGSLVADHIRLFVLDRPRVRQALPRLLSLLRRLSPDIIVSSAPHINHPLLAARRALHRHTRIVVREANLPSRALPFFTFPRMLAWGLSHLYPKADAVIATSSRMRDELTSFGVPAASSVVVPNPVDVDHIRESVTRPQRQPGDGRRFLAVGRLVPQKGLGRLIAIMQGLPEEDHLTILGEGPERSRLEEVIEYGQMRDRVSLVGFVANPWAWMAGADVLVVPSFTEGLPNAVLEALACGTPVIATPECGGIGDIAQAAEVGAVQIVPIEHFPRAMDAVEVTGPTTRQARLPPQYAKHVASTALSEALLALVSAAARREPCGPI